MTIIRDRPPLFDEIDAKFKVRGKAVIFAWGDKIYVPSGSLDLHPSLIAHERVHGDRQLRFRPFSVLRGATFTPEECIRMWWLTYIQNIDFRREEEVLAHTEEYRHLCQHSGGRNDRRRHLSVVASKLSAPIYGPLMNKSAARKVLSDGYSTHP